MARITFLKLFMFFTSQRVPNCFNALAVAG